MGSGTRSWNRPVAGGRAHQTFGAPNIGKFLILLLIVLLLFSSRLPSVARALGQSVIEFKKGFKELEDHTDDNSSA
jgi:TatA/E family protein of Tat protein translocase